jgi:putative heme iron utilization protein
MAEAHKLVDEAAIEAAAERYYRYFPDAGNYHKAHDFDFWVLQPVRHRYIGGFGAIHWLDQVTLANPFAGKAEASMIEHMNSDHAKAIAHYVQLTELPRSVPAHMVGIDSEGMHLRIGQAVHWLAFPSPCNTPTQVREALVLLAHADQWPVAAEVEG